MLPNVYHNTFDHLCDATKFHFNNENKDYFCNVRLMQNQDLGNEWL